MFITVSLEDVIRVPPGSLGGAVAVRGVLADELEARYADAVLPGIGLVVCLWAIDAVAGARVAPGDGGAYTRVSGGRRVGGRLLCCAAAPPRRAAAALTALPSPPPAGRLPPARLCAVAGRSFAGARQVCVPRGRFALLAGLFRGHCRAALGAAAGRRL